MRKWYQKGVALALSALLCANLFTPITIQAKTEDEGNDYLNVEVKKEYVYHTFQLTNDPFAKYQWAFDNTGIFKYKEILPSGYYGKTIYSKAGVDIGLEKGLAYYKEHAVNRPIIVAIIDTGVDTKQEDLQGHLWINELEKENKKDDDANGLKDDINGWNFYDNSKYLCNYASFDEEYQEYEDDHGTHCAGTIVATPNNGIGVAGIAGDANVKLMIIKALGGKEGEDAGTGLTSSIVQAINYAEKMGAQICNLSFGGDEEDPALKQVMKESNMLFICASGNDGQDTDKKPIYPASYELPNVISVANINSDGTLAASSNYGVQSVDLAAPGSEIVSTLVGNDYGRMTGTSMAAPMVTGASALLYSFYENMTAQDAKNIILNSTKKLSTLSGKVKTGGMLDIEAMLKTPYTPSTEHKETELTLSLGELEGSYGKNLNINVDSKRDLVEVRIQKGEISLEEFQKQKGGTALKLDKVQQYKIKEPGSYTVYIRDRAGIEKTETVQADFTIPLKAKGSTHKSKISLLKES